MKLLPDGSLQQFVRLLVHAGCGLVDTQELQGGGFRGLDGGSSHQGLKATAAVLLWPGSAGLWPGTAAASVPLTGTFLAPRLQHPDHLAPARRPKQVEESGRRGTRSHKRSAFRPLTHSVDHSAEVALLQHIQQLGVRVSPARVQILPDGAAEQKGVLGNDGQAGPAGGATAAQTANRSSSFDRYIQTVEPYLS